MKTWYDGLVKEGDRVICIDAISGADFNKYFLTTNGRTSGAYPKIDQQFKVGNGCLSLYTGPGIYLYPVMGYDDKPMPTKEWFFDHFALLT